jgi:hypothetical protein
MSWADKSVGSSHTDNVIWIQSFRNVVEIDMTLARW